MTQVVASHQFSSRVILITDQGRSCRKDTFVQLLYGRVSSPPRFAQPDGFYLYRRPELNVEVELNRSERSERFYPWMRKS